MTKDFYLYERFFVSNKNFTTEHRKIIKNSRFFKVFFKFFQNPGFLCLNCRIPGFSMFPGKPCAYQQTL